MNDDKKDTSNDKAQDSIEALEAKLESLSAINKILGDKINEMIARDDKSYYLAKYAYAAVKRAEEGKKFSKVDLKNVEKITPLNLGNDEALDNVIPEPVM